MEAKSRPKKTKKRRAETARKRSVPAQSRPKKAKKTRRSKLGQQILRERKELELTQSNLAELFRVATLTVSRWETGKSPPQAPGAILLALECLKLKRALNRSELLHQLDERSAEVEKMQRRIEREREGVERSLK